MLDERCGNKWVYYTPLSAKISAVKQRNVRCSYNWTDGYSLFTKGWLTGTLLNSLLAFSSFDHVSYAIVYGIYGIIANVSSLYTVLHATHLILTLSKINHDIGRKIYKGLLIFHLISAGSDYFCFFMAYLPKGTLFLIAKLGFMVNQFLKMWNNLYVIWGSFTLTMIQVPIIYLFYRISKKSGNSMFAVQSFLRSDSYFRNLLKASIGTVFAYFILKFIDSHW